MAWTEADFDRMMGRGVVRVVGEGHGQRSPVITGSLAHEALQIWHPTGVTLQLPIPTSMNHYWRSVICGSGSRVHVKVLLSEKGRRYRIDAGREVLRQWPAHILRPVPWRVRLIMAIFPPDKRTFDVDNRIKGVMDLLQAVGVYQNDSQVDDLHILRCGAVGHPGRVVVQISEIE